MFAVMVKMSPTNEDDWLYVCEGERRVEYGNRAEAEQMAELWAKPGREEYVRVVDLDAVNG